MNLFKLFYALMLAFIWAAFAITWLMVGEGPDLWIWFEAVSASVCIVLLLLEKS